MADNTNMQTLYSREFVQAYQQEQSWLRGTVMTEGSVNGNTFVFNISGVVEAAKKRGSNGLIPYGSDGQTTASVTLEEYFGQPLRKTNFNIMSSAPNQRDQMQKDGVKSINYTTDQMILTQLDATTQSWNGGTAVTLDVNKMVDWVSTFFGGNIPNDGEVYGLLTPRAWARAMLINQFASGDWVPDKPFMKWTQWRQWMGVKWCMHTKLTGTGTAAAYNYLYHKQAVGHGLNDGDFKTAIGYNEEHDYSWAYSRSYQGAKLLQNGGVYKMKHDDSTAIGS